MHLNSLKPAFGSKIAPKRLGRGIGSGLGKTSGRGHKGQKARSGGFHKLGFEGGQSPLQRRLPKFGFASRKSFYLQELRLDALNRFNETVIDLAALKRLGLVSPSVKKVKLILKGDLKRQVTIKGLKLSRGAEAAVRALGGFIEA